jgi:hypothetical protein
LNDLFDWGNDKFVLGKLPDANKNGTRRKKTHQEIFMEAILDDVEESTPKEETKEDKDKSIESETTEETTP